MVLTFFFFWWSLSRLPISGVLTGMLVLRERVWSSRNPLPTNWTLLPGVFSGDLGRREDSEVAAQPLFLLAGACSWTFRAP